MRQRIILFDIDYTLINTDILRTSFNDLLIKSLQIPKAAFDKIHSEYTSSLSKSTDFSPDRLINKLSKTYNAPKKELLKIYYANPSLYRKSLYPDTTDTLSKLHTIHRLGIFSEGKIKFQKTKLSASGIDKFFDEKLTFILHRKLSPQSLRKLPKGSILVDDNLEVIRTLTKLKDVTPLYIDRKSNKSSFIKTLSPYL